MKRLSCLFLVLLLVIATASCGKPADAPTNNSTADAIGTKAATNAGNTGFAVDGSTSSNGASSASSTVAGSNTDSGGSQNTGEREELLQSASVDLDSDGTKEQIVALQRTVKSQTDNEADELEGILRITGKDGTKDVIFIRKPLGVTGVMSSLQFKDLDGDGTKDIFVIIPDAGASFSLNYFYIYNYKTGKSFSYNSDTSLADFTGGFSFKYKGKGLLQMKNDNIKFTATFNISDGSHAPSTDDEGNTAYDSSWVDPTPVEINVNSINSKMELVDTAGGTPEIKVPLPVFGMATNDMIGEIDLYYSVNSDFKPIMKRFVVKDFKDAESSVIGMHTFF
jgi:hypothetical protein